MATTINAERSEPAEPGMSKLSESGVLSAGSARSAFDVVTPKPRAAISWSGGKDSCAALQRTREQFEVVAMITMFDENASRSRSHGLRPEVVAAQAASLGLRQIVGRCSWSTYDDTFVTALAQAASEGITHVIFGDILFPEHRQWAETMCARAGLVAVEPLWGSSTTVLFEEWIASGADALIVTTRAALLDHSWLGRRLTADLLPLFEQLGVDPCGERGEYHTVVTNSPMFRQPLRLLVSQSVQRADCWALDVIPDAARD